MEGCGARRRLWCAIRRSRSNCSSRRRQRPARRFSVAPHRPGTSTVPNQHSLFQGCFTPGLLAIAMRLGRLRRCIGRDSFTATAPHPRPIGHAGRAPPRQGWAEDTGGFEGGDKLRRVRGEDTLPQPLPARNGESGNQAACEGLLEVGDDVLHILEADREPHHFRPGAGLDLLGVGELAVGGGGGMDDERARVADIGKVREKLARPPRSSRRRRSRRARRR